MLLNTKPLVNKKKKTNNKYVDYARTVINSKYFDPVIHTCVGLNILFLMVKHVNMSQGVKAFVIAMNFIFTIVFTFEAILKIYAYRRLYFYDSWNRFDFFIVIFTWFGIIFQIIF